MHKKQVELHKNCEVEAAVARACGVSQATVRKIRNGHRNGYAMQTVCRVQRELRRRGAHLSEEDRAFMAFVRTKAMPFLRERESRG